MDSIMARVIYTPHLDEKVGKVRNLDLNCQALNRDQILIYTSDRLSANDQALGEIIGKGQVLSQLGAWWFDQLSQERPEVPHHYLYSSNVNTWVCKRTQPIMLEFIVRNHLYGSMWRKYESGERSFNGITLPDNMIKGNVLPCGPIVTIKETEPGKHDCPITRTEIISQGIMTVSDYQRCEELALKVFKFGREVCQKHKLILVDTKYEFGYDTNTGEIMLIDEIHTPDSSRFWGLPGGELFMTDDGPIVQTFDKDIARQYLNNNPHVTTLPVSIQNQLLNNYTTVYELLMGHSFRISSNNDNNIIIMAGSLSDKWYCDKIIKEIENNCIECNWHIYYMSAHKNTPNVLNYLNSLSGKNIIITVAEASNALSGIVACNSKYPVFACPPFKDKVDMIVNINSILQMPSNTPVMTVLSIGNVIKCCKRIISY